MAKNIFTLPDVGFVREPIVLAHVGFGRTKWRSLVADGKAPAPLRLGPRCTMYDCAAIRAWIADQAANAPVVMPKKTAKPAGAAPTDNPEQTAAIAVVQIASQLNRE